MSRTYHDKLFAVLIVASMVLADRPAGGQTSAWTPTPERLPFAPSILMSKDGELCARVHEQHLKEFLRDDRRHALEIKQNGWARYSPPDMTVAFSPVDPAQPMGLSTLDIDLDNDGTPEAFLEFNSFTGGTPRRYVQVAIFESRAALDNALGGSVWDALRRGKPLTYQAVDIDPKSPPDFGFDAVIAYKSRHYIYGQAWSSKRERLASVFAYERAGRLTPLCYFVRSQNAVPADIRRAADTGILTLPALIRFDNALANINGRDRPESCRGSHSAFVYLFRHRGTVLQDASFHPWRYLNDDRETIIARRLARLTIAELTSWANDGIWNFRVFRDLRMAAISGQTELESYYIEKFGMPADLAQRAARNVIADLVAGAFSFPEGTFQRNAAQLGLSFSGTAVQAVRLMDHDPDLDWPGIEMEQRDFVRRTIDAPDRPAAAVALAIAVLNGMPAPVVQELLDRGSRIPGVEPDLSYAIEHPELIRLLLDRGANVNERNRFGKTPLMYAAQFNLLESLALLLDRGADPALMTDEPQNTECTAEKTDSLVVAHGLRPAMLYAAENAALPVIIKLIGAGAPLLASDSAEQSTWRYLERNPRLDAADRERLADYLR